MTVSVVYCQRCDRRIVFAQADCLPPSSRLDHSAFGITEGGSMNAGMVFHGEFFDIVWRGVCVWRQRHWGEYYESTYRYCDVSGCVCWFDSRCRA